MDALLLTGIDPGKVKVWACQETSVIGSLIPPMDLCYIAAYLESRGHSAAVLDLRLEPDWRTALLERLDRDKPRFVCMNLTSLGFPEDAPALRFVRAHAPQTRVCCFGTHANALSREVLSDCADIVLVGDPEQCMLNAVEGRAEGLATPDRPDTAPAFLPSPDAVPFDGPRFIDLDRYHAAHHGGVRFLPLMASRGCPYSCSFCPYPSLFGPDSRTRYRSTTSMVDELEHLSRHHGVRSVNYLDATFNLDRRRLLSFCRELASRKIPIVYACNLRCDLIDAEVARALAISGCKRAYLGVEDPEMNDQIQKDLAFESVLTAFRLLKEEGVFRCAFLMLFPDGAPDEDTYFRRMRNLIRKIEPDAIQVNVSIPHPGTPDFEAQRNRLTLDWNLFDPSGPERLPYPCSLDLNRIKRRLYRDFVRSNPGKVIGVLREMRPRHWAPLAKRFVSELLLPKPSCATSSK